MNPLRILVHDYSGHPFQIHLSRELARRGHVVCHAYSASFQTPHGTLVPLPRDPETLSIRGISLAGIFAKEQLWRRRWQEIEYGKKLAKLIEEFGPNIVISANTPLDAQALALRQCRKTRARFVFWVQDIYGVAIDRLLRQRLPVLGAMIGKYYISLERRLLRRSDSVVLISEDFRQIVSTWGLYEDALFVIENWAPIDEVPVYPKENPWAVSHGLAKRFCFLYTGTLGMKHNPDLLVKLAMHFRDDPEVTVLVRSEGGGANWLIRQKQQKGLDNLQVDGFVDFRDYPMVLAAADVLVAILEPDAGVFSVPSKVLSYLCANRPLLLAVPSENLAARIVREHDAGVVVSPRDHEAFLRAAERLRNDSGLRNQYAANARSYAETHFDIEAIADRFEEVMKKSLGT